MNIYSEILNECADKSKEPRYSWYSTPYAVDNFSIATNAEIMAIVPRHISPVDEATDEKAIKSLSFFPNDNSNYRIELTVLKEALLQCPLTEGYDIVGKDVKCTECDGEGYVEWTYKNYEKEHECPVCEGMGISETARHVPNGKMVFESYKYIKIGPACFNVKYLDMLGAFTERLEQDHIDVVFVENERRPMVFKIKDLRFLIMPVSSCETIAKIDLT